MDEATTTSDALPRELPAERPRAPRRRLPVATYRVQLHAGFGFAAAAAVVPYLDRLGITDCYTSPHLKARPGSTHGYDIVDHTALNPELGGASDDYDAFAAALAARGMGNLVDFVPNHMGVDAAANPWWRDVLENGRGSTYACFFDIDWNPVKAELKDKVLLPILGDQYGAVLERGELQLHFADGAFALRYGPHDLPIAPGQIPQILSHQLDQLRAWLGDEHPELNEYLSIITELRNLPPPTETDPVQVAERQREKDVARERLLRLVERAPRVREHIDACVAAFNGPGGRALLHGLLEAQAYRLANWRTASHEINYRRFFDINELAGLRVENPRVFTATHALLLQLVAARQISGIRLDHIDGLFDPAGYLAALQDAIAAAARQGDAAQTEGSSAAYVVVEKILAADEHLPAEWPVAGTTGYDFLNLLNGLFVDRRNQRALLRLHARFTGEQRSFADVLYESKTLIMRGPMASELHVLAVALNRLSEHDWHTRDFTLTSLRGALREVVACFPVYRTYVSAAGYRDSDRQAVDSAIARARRRNPTMEPSIFDFLRSVLLPDPNARPAGAYAQRLEFAMKFQQYTGPVEAKGREDTSFYRYAPLASLNEVGGGPERFGRTPREFHAANQERLAAWGTGLLATATHDTKRGEDARARLNVLSECPAEWGRQVSTWARVNATNRSRVDGEAAPDRRDEYLFYQTLLGAWPARATAVDPTLVERLTAFMLKAAREAKVHTSWLTQNAPYEESLTRFVERVLTGRTAARFLDLFLPFQARIAELGMVNSLAQLVLKLVAPGVPDFFQGTELWDLSLVDPDNRRPVDYARRQQLLAELDAARVDTPAERRAWLGALLEHWDDARIKLLTTAELLRLRRRNAALFLTGTYEALEVGGAHADHVVALARRHGEQVVLAVLPRLVAGLTTPERRLPLGAECWQDTAVMLPPDLATLPLRDLLTHEPLITADGGLPLREALSTLPVALAVASDS